MKSDNRSEGRVSNTYGLDSFRPKPRRFDRNGEAPKFTVSQLEKYCTTREQIRPSIRSSKENPFRTQWKTFIRFTSKEEETMRVFKEKQHSAYDDKLE